MKSKSFTDLVKETTYQLLKTAQQISKDENLLIASLMATLAAKAWYISLVTPQSMYENAMLLSAVCKTEKGMSEKEHEAIDFLTETIINCAKDNGLVTEEQTIEN